MLFAAAAVLAPALAHTQPSTRIAVTAFEHKLPASAEPRPARIEGLGAGIAAHRFVVHHPRDPVNVATGNLHLTSVDLRAPARGLSLEVVRTYNSQAGRPGIFGHNWASNLEVRVEKAGGQGAIVVEADGYSNRFAPETRGAARLVSLSRGYQVLERDAAGSWRRTAADGSTHQFDAAGRLQKIEDHNRNAIVLSYDGRRLVGIEDFAGRKIALAYDRPDSRVVSSATDALGRTVRFRYDASDNLIEVTDPAGRKTSYAHDARHRITRIGYPDGAATSIAYDPTLDAVIEQRGPGNALTRLQYLGDRRAGRNFATTVSDAAGNRTRYEYRLADRTLRVTDATERVVEAVTYDPTWTRPVSQTSGAGDVTAFQYDARMQPVAMRTARGISVLSEYAGVPPRPTTLRDSEGSVAALAYDNRGNLVRYQDAMQRVWAFSYDGAGQIVGRTDPAGRVSRFTHDAAGNLTRITDPAGSSTGIEYDAIGRATAVVDRTGLRTGLRYDAAGNLVERHEQGIGATRFEYDAMDRLVARVDASGGRTRFEYDPIGRQVARTDPLEGTVRYTYDQAGHREKVIDAAGREHRYEHDQAGRRTKEVDPLGHASSYVYDPAGRVSAGIDAAGQRLELRYGAKGELASVIEAGKVPVALEYDKLGRISGVTDTFGLQWRHAYDRADRLVSVTDPAAKQSRYEYDPAGNLVQLTRPDDRTTRYSYDSLDRLIESADGLARKERFEYDREGRLSARVDPSGRRMRYAYDAAGRLAKKIHPAGEIDSFVYDARGNLTSAAGSGGEVRYAYDALDRRTRAEYPGLGKSIEYSYDKAGNLASLRGPDGGVTRYSHDAADRLKELTLPDGGRFEFGYDVLGRRTRIKYPNGVVADFRRDAAGRIGEMLAKGAAGESVKSIAYRRDRTGRVIERREDQAAPVEYGYDSLGQLQAATSQGSATQFSYAPDNNRVAMVKGTVKEEYKYDAADQLVQAGSRSFSHDANGNLVERRDGSKITRYHYDAEDRLVKVVVPDGREVNYGYLPTGERFSRKEGREIVYYLHDRDHVIAEMSANGSALATYVHGSAIDEPLAMLRGGTPRYYHHDALGSVVALTDRAGKVTARYAYDAFGLLVEASGGEDNPFTYTGREWDRTTGLYHYRTRYYDPTLGRFISRDLDRGAIRNPRSLNPYVYVENDPINFIDPYGTIKWVKDKWGEFYDWLTNPKFEPTEDIKKQNQGRTSTTGRTQPASTADTRAGSGTGHRSGTRHPDEKGFTRIGPIVAVVTVVVTAINIFTSDNPGRTASQALGGAVGGGLGGAAAGWAAGAGIAPWLAPIPVVGPALAGGTVATCTFIGGCYGAAGGAQAAGDAYDSLNPPPPLTGLSTLPPLPPPPLSEDAVATITPPVPAGGGTIPQQSSSSGYDPRGDRGMGGGTGSNAPAQLAAAQGLAGQVDGGIPGGPQRKPGKGGQPDGQQGGSQGGYQNPPPTVKPEGPPPNPLPPDMCPAMDEAGNVRVWVPCPPGVFPGTPLPPQARTRPGTTVPIPPRPGASAPVPPAPPGVPAGGTVAAIPPITPSAASAAPPATGQQCDAPLCREMSKANCESLGSGFGDCSQVSSTLPSCGRSNFTLAEVKAACYQNMKTRCDQGMSGRTGGWCVRDKNCVDRAHRTCGCNPSTHPQCSGKWG